MASPLELRRRIRSVDNTRQITRAMQLVAASRMRRAQEAVQAARPYATHISGMIERLVLATGNDRLPPILQPRPIERTAFLVLTTNRGLAGPLNTNIVRTAVSEIDATSDAIEISVVVVGKKGHLALRGLYTLSAVFTDISDQPSVLDIAPVTQLLVDGYERGDFDEVRMVYPEFVNILTQQPRVVRLFPVVLPEVQQDAREADIIFEPDPASVLEALIPRFVEMTVYRAMLELAASEQSARMVAMRAATENATELIEGLRLAYNKLRQARITSEIIDIASGANALADA
ncbi:MAG: ATP synthase F1 subunit gamma [Chloroflexi bacterium]|nr:ATP synthase F1 subunit gamma [Chloroflexota bacterium]